MRGGDNVILRDLAVRFVSVDTQLAEGVGDTTAEHGDEDDHHGQEETWVAEEQRVIILDLNMKERRQAWLGVISAPRPHAPPRESPSCHSTVSSSLTSDHDSGSTGVSRSDSGKAYLQRAEAAVC